MRSFESRQQRTSALTVGDALEFLRRRRWICMGTIVTIVAASVLLAYKLPPVYRAEATILIEQPAIPTEIVQSTVRSYIDEQIQVVSQRVMTKENIQGLVEEYELYVKLRETQPIEIVIENFRADTDLVNRTAEVFDPRRGRVTGSTFAFVVAYHNSDPIKTQQVTNRLANVYLEENSRSRREQASETTSFLEQEAERLSEDIAEIEKKLAEYKDENADALPEQLMLNMQTLDRRERELLNTRQELIDLRSQHDQAQAQLSSISPYVTLLSDSGQTIASSGDRQTMLREEYLQLTGRYGSEHPDVLRVKREIDALTQAGAIDMTDDIDQRIAALVEQRSALLDRYAPEHPDVLRLNRSIGALQEERGRLVSSRTTEQVRAPNNPEYIGLQRQIDASSESIRATENRRFVLRADIDELERNIATAPSVEQEWLTLNRGYEAARAEFNDVTQRSTQARLSERLEEESKGQRFTLLESARLPVTPIEPNRVSIIFLGVVLALGAGIGLAALVDTLDTSIRSVRDLSELLQMRPTATIPYVVTARELHVRRIQRRMVIAGAAAGTIALVWSLS